MLTGTSLKEIKESPWFWFLGLLLTAFVTGFAAYPGLMAMLGRTHVADETLKAWQAAVEAVPRLQERLALASAEAQALARAAASARPPVTASQAASSPPVQQTQTFRGSGTYETNIVAVSAAPHARKVRLYARATALGGSSGKMSILISGTTLACASGDFYHTQNGRAEINGQKVCEELLPAGESREYMARAPNVGADARSIDLEVTVGPQ